MQIKDKFDLLEYFVDHMDPDTKTYTKENQELYSLVNALDFSQYLQELKVDNCIKVYLGGNFVLYDKAIQIVEQRKKERSKSYFVLKISKKAFKWILVSVGSILVALITAFLIWKFGWN